MNKWKSIAAGMAGFRPNCPSLSLPYWASMSPSPRERKRERGREGIKRRTRERTRGMKIDATANTQRVTEIKNKGREQRTIRSKETFKRKGERGVVMGGIWSKPTFRLVCT